MTPLKVLHIDDEDDIREVAAFSLEIDPLISLHSAGSGAEGLAVLDAGHDPDVILLDVMMPGLDGPGTLSLIRQRPDHAHTHVIFMTARARTSEVEEYKALGALGVIVKPFDPMSLARDLRDILAGGGQ
ncbi:response regulator [Brevundimonas sp. DC300-4]|uniref:response regulator n=1 Tax=Brevundimonas sp. DC300-4 TaxID=2804594 RepID=UPI003CF38706